MALIKGGHDRLSWWWELLKLWGAELLIYIWGVLAFATVRLHSLICQSKRKVRDGTMNHSGRRSLSDWMMPFKLHFVSPLSVIAFFTLGMKQISPSWARPNAAECRWAQILGGIFQLVNENYATSWCQKRDASTSTKKQTGWVLHTAENRRYGRYHSNFCYPV
jgi:hypothetical protein